MAISGMTYSTSLTELINSEWISDFIQSYAKHYENPSQFLAAFDPKLGTNTVAIPRWVSDQGTPANASAQTDDDAVDTEYDVAENDDMTYTELETTESTFNLSEYGLVRLLSDRVVEDAVNGGGLAEFVAGDCASIIGTAKNDDVCALFASFTASSGSTNTDLSVATVDDALYDLAERGILGDVVGIFDFEAVRNFQDALQATGTSWAVYPAAAATLMGVQATDLAQQRPPDGFVLSYKGMDIYRNGLCDTANTAADVVSAIFVRGDMEANRASVALAQATRRPFRMEAQRDASARATELVASHRWGCGIARNDSGQKVISDQP